MARQLTKEQFRAQFQVGPCSFPDADMQPDDTGERWHGYAIFQCLNAIFLRDENGKFWCNKRHAG